MTASPADEIRVEYQQNFDNWYTALIAAGMLPKHAWIEPLVATLLIGLGAFAAWKLEDLYLASVLTSATLVFGWYALLKQVLRRGYLRKRWMRSRNQNVRLRLCFRENEIVIDSDQMHSTLMWSAAIEYLLTPNLLICVLGTGNLLIIPKENLSADELQLLIDLLERKISPEPQTHGFPVSDIRQKSD